MMVMIVMIVMVMMVMIVMVMIVMVMMMMMVMMVMIVMVMMVMIVMAMMVTQRKHLPLPTSWEATCRRRSRSSIPTHPPPLRILRQNFHFPKKSHHKRTPTGDSQSTVMRLCTKFESAGLLC